PPPPHPFPTRRSSDLSHATIVPAAPSVTSNITAAEAVEHYWAALLRDVPFTEYAGNPTVAEAVADMNNLSFINGSQNFEFPSPVDRKSTRLNSSHSQI